MSAEFYLTEPVHRIGFDATVLIPVARAVHERLAGIPLPEKGGWLLTSLDGEIAIRPDNDVYIIRGNVRARAAQSLWLLFCAHGVPCVFERRSGKAMHAIFQEWAKWEAGDKDQQEHDNDHRDEWDHRTVEETEEEWMRALRGQYLATEEGGDDQNPGYDGFLEEYWSAAGENADPSNHWE